jgi:hypothetical protein
VADALPVLEGLSYLVTILGVPAAIYLFIRERRIDRDLKIREIYSAVDDSYTDFIKTLLDNPDIDFLRADVSPEVIESAETSTEKRRRWLLTSLLISIFERAYLLYRQSPNEMLRSQWAGWEAWALDYLARDDVRAVWDTIGKDFDTNFYEHIDCRLHGRQPPAMRTRRWS